MKDPTMTVTGRGVTRSHFGGAGVILTTMHSNIGSRSTGKSAKAIEPDEVDSTDPSFVAKDGHGGPLSAEDELAGALYRIALRFSESS